MSHSTLIPPRGEQPSLHVHESLVRVGASCELDIAQRGTDLMGIAGVRINGVTVRSASRCWRPHISTPQGLHYTTLRCRDLIPTPDGGCRLTLDALGQPGGFREQLDEYLGDVVDLAMSQTPVTDELVWEFRPSRVEIAGRVFEGFAYRYRFTASSPQRQIYRLFDHATWEIGGTLAGNTLRLQGQCNPPVVPLQRDTDFTTACNYYGAEMRGITGTPQRVSFQRLPRIGTLQAFDLLLHDDGALLGMFEPVDEIFTVIQTHRGEDVLHVLDEHRQPMSDVLTTHWKHILLHRSENGAWSQESQQNVWWDVCRQVHEQARERRGIKASAVQPRVWLPQVAHDEVSLLGRTFPRDRFLYELADEAVPRWADMGVKEICAFSLWTSDYTVDRQRTKQGQRNPLHGALIVGSICNVRDHVIDPLWGGPEALAYFRKKAHARGMQVQLWWATHMSRRATIYQQRPEFMLEARDGLPNGGGFGHDGPVTADLNNPDCFDYFVSKLKAVHELTGIDGLFHDSYGNMTFLPTSFTDPARRGQQDAYERIVVKLQSLGLRHFTVEGIGPFGVGHFGMNLLDDNSGYQNALDWWVGHEDMIAGLNMGIEAGLWRDEQKARLFSFRCIAFGGRFGFTQRRDGIEVWDGWLCGHNRMLGRVGPLMGQRIVLPEGRGVQWHMPDGSDILFSFTQHTQHFAQPRRIVGVTDVDESLIDTVDQELATQPMAVYRLAAIGAEP